MRRWRQLLGGIKHKSKSWGPRLDDVSADTAAEGAVGFLVQVFEVQILVEESWNLSQVAAAREWNSKD